MKAFCAIMASAALAIITALPASAQRGVFSGPSGNLPTSGSNVSVAGGWKSGGYTQAYTSWGDSEEEADHNASYRCRKSGSKGCDIIGRASDGECLYIAVSGKTWSVQRSWRRAAQICEGFGPCEEEILKRCSQ